MFNDYGVVICGAVPSVPVGARASCWPGLGNSSLTNANSNEMYRKHNSMTHTFSQKLHSSSSHNIRTENKRVRFNKTLSIGSSFRCHHRHKFYWIER
ncbi:hypothetical protein BLOT_004342 [Blomia tropicalis]|nr:hypothetical protein BLOT_004342 [Blomia tropicalis]